jgi:predicted Fe-S protein YdhL (DUF1289 family)
VNALSYDPAPILSPCIQVCAIDPVTGLCAGCGRTLDEIARWSSMSEQERARVMQQLPARKTEPVR